MADEISIVNREGQLGGEDSDGNEVPVPFESLSSEQIGFREISSSRYLEHDETDESGAFETMLEDVEGDGPARIRLEDDVVVESGVVPDLSGNRIEIVGIGEPTIDATGNGGEFTLDLFDAANVSLRYIRFEGSEGAEHDPHIRPGDNFIALDLEIDGGQGGFRWDASGEESRTGGLIENVTVSGQRDTDSGEASAINIRHTSNVTVRGFDVSDCDRGIEIEDGASKVLVENGSVDNIDNSQASDPGSCFSLNVHAHAGEEVSDVILRNIRVSNTLDGVTVEGNDVPEDLTNVRLEDIETESTGNNRFDAENVVIRGWEVVSIDGDTTGFGALQFNGGTSDVSGVRGNGGSGVSQLLQYRNEGEHVARNCVAGSDFSRIVQVNSNAPDHLVLEDFRAESDGNGEIDIQGVPDVGVANVNRHHVVIRDCDMASTLNVDAADAVVLVEGGYVEATSIETDADVTFRDVLGNTP